MKTCTRKYEKEGFGREGENEKEAEGRGGREGGGLRAKRPKRDSTTPFE